MKYQRVQTCRDSWFLSAWANL